MEYQIAVFLGGLVPTLLVSRLLLWVMRSWSGALDKLLVVHAGSLVSVTLIAGMGMADGGAFAPIEAASRYLIPQIVWFVVDAVRYEARRAAQ